MKKMLKYLTLGFSCVLLTSCFGAGEKEKEKVELTGIEITVDKTTCEVDDYASFTASFIPSNANTYKGKELVKENFVYYVDDERKSTGFNFALYPKMEKEYSVCAYYAENPNSDSREGDLKSNVIKVNGFIKAEDKVVFKCYVGDNGTVTLQPGKLFNTVTDMVVPAEVNGHKITCITNLFRKNKNIRTLRFDKNLSRNFEIGENAFKDCVNLKYVSLPYQVTKIGEDAFTNIDPDSKIFIEETSRPKGYYYQSLLGYWNNNEDNDFYNCKDFLETDDFVFGVSVTDELYLAECKNRNSNLVIPNEVNGMKVTKILRNTFKDATYLKSVSFPEDLLEIESSAFNGCTGIEIVRIPNKTTTIGVAAFLGCSNVKFVTIPQSVVKVDKNAFERLNEDVAIFVEHAEIPKGFDYNSLLSYWHYPYNNVYTNCSDYVIDGDFVYGVTPTNEYYLCKYFGRTSKLEIPSKVNDCPVTKIAKYCFKDANFLTSVVVPENVTSIGDYAFSKCTSLSSVKLPETLLELGEYAFEEDTALTSIIIPIATTKAGERCFYKCSNLEIFVTATSRPSGFDYLSSASTYNWNAGVKKTYFGINNEWYLDSDGIPHHY